MDETKPNSILTPEALEKLAKARAKANEIRHKNYEIKKFEMEQAKKRKKRKRTAKERRRKKMKRIMLC